MGTLMVSVSGIRGVYGDSLTPNVILKYVAAFAAYCKGTTIVLGRDSRKTGASLSDLIKGILAASGYRVIDCGIVPTPTVLLMVEKLKADGGIIITASHNPVEWNALKLASRSGMFLTQEEGAEFLAMAEKGDHTYTNYAGIGSVEYCATAVDTHIEEILRSVDVEKIRARRFHVVLDCVHGAGGVMTPKLLDALHCTYSVLYEEPSGDFPREPEPIPERLTELADAVRMKGADIGFAHDPDVDRLALVADGGLAISEEYTLALATWSVMERKKGVAVCNLSTSRMIDDVAARFGGSVVRTPVGEVNVADKMRAIHAVVGGEGNGGVINPDVHFTRDAPVGVALLLDLLARHDKPLSALLHDIPKYVMIKEKVSFATLPERVAAMDKLHNLRSFEDAKINLEDGVRLDFNEGWIHIRPSGTEPVIRLIAEGESEQWVRSMIDTIRKKMGL